jgi:hypothetical protein
VVYLTDGEYLRYKGRFFSVPIHLEDDWEIVDLFLVYYNGKERMIVNYETPESSDVVQKVCGPIVVPDSDQKAKLTVLFQQHGASMCGAATELLDKMTLIQTLSYQLKTEVDAICPGFDIEWLNLRTAHQVPLVNTQRVDLWKKEAENLRETGSQLSKGFSFSKKSKAD